MSERELPKLRGVGDRLIADVAKPSHVPDKIFILVVLTNGDNCCLLDSQSHQIVGTLSQRQGPAKQTRERRWCVGASPMLDSDKEIERENYVSFSVGYPMSFPDAIPSLFMKEEDD